MSKNTPHKITPHIPFYKQQGCTEISRSESDFVDRNGNKAILTTIVYSDKKGNVHEAVIQVQWIS